MAIKKMSNAARKPQTPDRAHQHSTECSVCLDDVWQYNPGVGPLADAVIELSCGHLYHRHCLAGIASKTDPAICSLCPVCRESFLPPLHLGCRVRVNLPNLHAGEHSGDDSTPAKGRPTSQQQQHPQKGSSRPEEQRHENDNALSAEDNWGAFRTMLHGRTAQVHTLEDDDPNGRAAIILDSVMEETGGIEGLCLSKISVPKSALLLGAEEISLELPTLPVAPPPPPKITTSCHVQINGLLGRTDLNGKYGVAKKFFAAKGRWYGTSRICALLLLSCFKFYFDTRVVLQLSSWNNFPMYTDGRTASVTL